MTMSDPIADMLTRIRNANTAKHATVDLSLIHISAEPMEETQAAGSTQEIVLPQELMQEEQSAGNTQEIVLPLSLIHI